GRFLFTQDEVLKVINDLSGGEKARLQLALLMLERNNVLILDEPTNHLDIDSKEMLEQALKNFEGTLIFVSHDRYFINELANRIFDLNKTGGHLYLGDYQYYLEKLEQQNALAAYDEQREDNNTSDDSARSQNTYQDQKALRREKRKIERQIEADEQKITELEARIAAIDVAMTDDTTMNDYEKTQALANERTSIEQSLEQVMTNWEELQLTLSQFEDEMD
ncbi:ATP-binding cassette domain-containing protein, partial [Staphylococcus pseudintermedius]|nr:ATP-binding cassette domain-containing protein [Staphylococcus pseudintermedius]